MASTVWKGFLTFGLISVPIKLFAAARREHVSFHQIHKPCGTRIRQQLWCPHDQRVVERSEIVKGYEEAQDTYIEVDPEELKKIELPSDRNMEIVQFVKLAEVDPIYFDASYYLTPEEPGRKAYDLLVQTLDKAGYAALAKLSMHQHEYLVVIRPRDHGLTLHTVYYENELNHLAEYGQPDKVEIRPQEIELAERLVENLAAPFEPEKFHDNYQKKVLELIDAKRQGQEVRAVRPQKLAPVVDLMDALQRSLAASGRKPPEPTTDIHATEIHVVEDEPAASPRKRALKSRGAA
ncbi:MAG TPA: Ku protein [Bryobacteraceae bacterium]|nr:Ku protein [Bryobacteraceae bacterium]